MTAPILTSVSIDLDDKWSYLKTYGDPEWRDLPSFLDAVIPRMLAFLDDTGIRATFFVVGLDATQDRNRELLRAIGEQGHEIGNHSHHHEPWLHRYSARRTRDELGRAHEAICEATGIRPVGFRGPGYSLSAEVLRTLGSLDYLYDASTLPTWMGPLARHYYFRSADFTAEERRDRTELFGTFRDGLRPLRPYRWGVPGGGLVEIPVTTMPLLRLPIHFTYLLYLGRLWPSMALRYLRLALALCQIRRIGPSMVLHPLEFLDPTDVAARNLGFLPGTDIPYETKRELLFEYLDLLAARYAIRPLVEYAGLVEMDRLRVRTPELEEAAP